MSQVALTDIGVGPFEYDGHRYYVAPASERMISSWPGSSTNVPTKEELNEIIYKNKEPIDTTDTTSGTKLSDIANGPNDASNGWNGVWSSTEISSTGAWSQRLSDGNIGSHGKFFEHWVVGIHKEPINDTKNRFKQLTFELVEEVNVPSSKSEAAIKLMRDLATNENFNCLELKSKNQILDIIEGIICFKP